MCSTCATASVPARCEVCDGKPYPVGVWTASAGPCIGSRAVTATVQRGVVPLRLITSCDVLGMTTPVTAPALLPQRAPGRATIGLGAPPETVHYEHVGLAARHDRTARGFAAKGTLVSARVVPDPEGHDPTPGSGRGNVYCFYVDRSAAEKDPMLCQAGHLAARRPSAESRLHHARRAIPIRVLWDAQG